ncbi:hypothetical protein ACTHSJ_05950 [Paenibacillus cellulositrophicus]|uniref:hypothetical protein n=1 Tax=Paenibacillus cellulositrophicus TaxID=562959 RepID=UPI003F7E50BA
MTGAARYTGDTSKPGLLHAALAVSPHAHARMLSIDTSAARSIPGVRADIIGEDFPVLIGICEFQTHRF